MALIGIGKPDQNLQLTTASNFSQKLGAAEVYLEDVLIDGVSRVELKG
jgi:hypothetical protein